MSNFGGKNSLFEKDFNSRVKPLIHKVSLKERELKELILYRIQHPQKSKAYWTKVNGEVKGVYSELYSIFSKWSKEEIPLRYRTSLRKIQKSVESKKNILNKADKNITKMVTSKTSYSTQQLLFMDANNLFLKGLSNGRFNIERFIRYTQQTILSESTIESTLFIELLDSGNLRKAANVLSGGFWGSTKDAIDKELFIQAGKYRYKASYYSKMVARVKFHEAQSMASLHQCKNYNTDLIQVSSHNTTTPICMEFEGKIYSIEGRDNRFPPLNEVPPYHPNCLHLLFPVFESALKVQGTLDSFSAFSKGKISKPPVPSGFVPISQRKGA